MGCESDCVNAHRLRTLEEELRELREKNSKDHEKFYNRSEDLERHSAIAENDLKHIKTTVDETCTNVNALMAAHGKRYDNFVMNIITGIVCPGLGYLLKGGTLPM